MSGNDETDRFAGRRLGVLISGRGMNLQSIIDAIARGDLRASIAVVVANRSDAAGLMRAREAGLPALCIKRSDHADSDAYDRALVDVLRSHSVDLVCLAGFMRV